MRFEHHHGVCGRAVDGSHFRIFRTDLVWVRSECCAGGVTCDGNQGEMTWGSKVNGYRQYCIVQYSTAAAQRVQEKKSPLVSSGEVQTLRIPTHFGCLSTTGSSLTATSLLSLPH